MSDLAYLAIPGAVVLMCATWVVYDRFLRFDKKTHPQGPFRMPVFGNLTTLASDRGFLAFDEYNKSIGRPGIISLQLGQRKAIMVFDMEGQKEMQSAKGNRGRHPFKCLDAAAPATVKEIGTYSPYFAKRLAFIKNELCMKKNLQHDEFKKTFDAESEAIVANIASSMKETDAATGIDPHAILQNANINLVLRLCLGTRWELQSKEFQTIMGINTKVFQLFQEATPQDFLSWAPRGGGYKTLVGLSAQRDELLRPIFDEAIKTYDAENPPRHFIDKCIQFSESSNEHAARFTHEEIYGILTGDIMLGAGDTVATAILWLCVHLSLYPEWQEKAYDEVRAFEANDKARAAEQGDEKLDPVRAENWHEWETVSALIYEGMRIRPEGPISFPRRTVEPITVKGFTIPADTITFANHYAIAHDERVWKDPDTFNPARFLDDADFDSATREKCMYGFGRRMCIGREFAMVAMNLYVAKIIRAYKISFATSVKNPTDEYARGVTITPKPLYKNFVFTPRESAE